MESKEVLQWSVAVAKNAGFVPVLLSGKVPVRPGWQKKTLETCGTFNSARAGQNIGVLTGSSSGIIVLDIEKNELDLWEEEVKKHEPIGKTLTVQTGRGGLHIYFTYDERVKHLRNAVKTPSQPFDLKTTGGQVVWINSKTESKYVPIAGFEVRKENGEETVYIDLVPMPNWLIEMFTARQR